MTVPSVSKFACVRDTNHANQSMKSSRPQQYALLCATISLALSYLLPNLTQPWLSFYREMMAYGFIFFLYWTLFPFFDKNISIPRSLWVIGLCLLIVLTQYIAGMILFAGDLIVIELFLTGIIISFICGATLFTPHGKQILQILLIILFGTAVSSALLAVIQWFGIDSLGTVFTLEAPAGDRVFANMAQPNHLATLLIMGFASGIYLFKQHKISLPPLLLCATLLAVASTLAESNTGILSTVLVTLFILFGLWKTHSKNQTIIWITLYWCVLTLLMFMSLNEIKHLLLLGEFASRLDTSATSRLSIYQQAWHGLSQQPWIGYGWLNTLSAVRVGAEHSFGSTPATYSHNFLLDILIWNGIPIGSFIIGALLYWGIRHYLLRINKDTFLICAITLPFWIHSMTEFPFAFAYFTFPVAVLCGYIDAASSQQQSHRLFLFNKQIMSLSVLSSALLGGVVVYAYIMAEKQFLLVRMFNKGIILEKPYENKTILLITQLDSFIKASAIQPKKNMDENDIILLRQVSLRFPSPLIESRYLLSLLLTNQYDLYRKELTSISNIHNANYSYGFNMYITNNPDVPDDIKQETEKILQKKIERFILEQETNLNTSPNN